MACLSSQRVCARAVQEKLMCQFLSKRNNFHRHHHQSQNQKLSALATATAPGLRNINDRRPFSTSTFFRSLNDSASGSGGGAAINQVSRVWGSGHIKRCAVGNCSKRRLLIGCVVVRPSQSSPQVVVLLCALSVRVTYFGKAV